jgi:hypothetical protein
VAGRARRAGSLDPTFTQFLKAVGYSAGLPLIWFASVRHEEALSEAGPFASRTQMRRVPTKGPTSWRTCRGNGARVGSSRPSRHARAAETCAAHTTTRGYTRRGDLDINVLLAEEYSTPDRVTGELVHLASDSVYEGNLRAQRAK